MKQIDELRQRFEALEPRERLFLAGGAVALVLVLFFLAVVQPLLQYRERAENRVLQQRELVAWMRGAVEVLRERGPVRQSGVDASGSLLALADTSARATGLGQAMRRIQQEGDNDVRVRLEAAAFDNLVRWLEDLENRNGVTASEISVERADAPGTVNASLTLTRNASS